MSAVLQETPYFNALCSAMRWLADDPRTIFVGQGVGVAGTTMTDTLREVPPHKLLEFPVAEDLQMGFCTGLSLEGYIPICIFPRWNFLICATNQIVNHLDRLPLYSDYRPHVIIRVATPITKPFNPGPQHDGDFLLPFQKMLRTMHINDLDTPESVTASYQHAMRFQGSTILAEYTGNYNIMPSGVAG